MEQSLQSLMRVSVLVFAVSSMLSVAFGYRFRDIVQPLKNVGAVVRALVANFVLVPALGVLLVKVLGLDAPLAIGLMLLASAAGAPFLIKLTFAASGNVGLSATLLIVLLPITVLYMPLFVPFAVPQADVNAMTLAMPLLVSLLLPLALGLLLHERWPALAKKLLPAMRKLSTAALIVFLACTIIINLGGILQVAGRRAILAAVLFVIGAFAIGYLLGERGRGGRVVLGLGTGQRNIAAATVVATQGFEEPDIILMVVIGTLVGMLVLFPLATWLRPTVHDKERALP